MNILPKQILLWAKFIVLSAACCYAFADAGIADNNAAKPNAGVDSERLALALEYVNETFAADENSRSLEPTALWYIRTYRRGQPALDKDAQKELEDEIVKRLRERYQRKIPDIAQLLALGFSKEELQYMLSFLHSDLGRSIERKLPEFMFAERSLLNADLDENSLTLFNDSVAAIRKRGRKL